MTQDAYANEPAVPSYRPQQLRAWALAVSSVMAFLAVVATSLRLLSRHIRKQRLWWDDYLVLFSQLWNWVVVSIALAMYAKGAGYHNSTIGPQSVVYISRLLLVAEIIYVWQMCWVKLSVLTMYYRIFHIGSFKRVVLGVGSFVVIWAIAGTFLFTFICVPTKKLWYPNLPGHCISEMGVWIANACSTIVSDVAILTLPIPQIWKLQTGRAEKLGLTLVFGSGFFTVFTSSYRVWVLFNYDKADLSYTLFPLLIWTQIEMCAALISASLPTLLPVVYAARDKLRPYCSCCGQVTPKNTSGTQSGHGNSTLRAQSRDLHSDGSRSRKATDDTFCILEDDLELADCPSVEHEEYIAGKGGVSDRNI